MFSTRNFLLALKELLFPACCLVCGARINDIQEMQICPTCLPEFDFVTPPFCSCCGDPFVSKVGSNHLCSRCLTKPNHFQMARSILVYNEKSAHLIHSFKYGRKTAALSTFNAFWQLSDLTQDFLDIDLIIPIPLHKKRLQWRGYNQAQLLAETFFRDQRQKICPFLLTRVKNTPPQTGLKGRDRRNNIRGAFSVGNPEKIASRKILLIDDVYTTGSTLNECALTLIKSGAESVKVLTLARVPSCR